MIQVHIDTLNFLKTTQMLIILKIRAGIKKGFKRVRVIRMLAILSLVILVS